MYRSVTSGLFAAAVTGALAAAGALPAQAQPLDAPACVLLDTEQKSLEAAGVAAQAERGPEWATANLDQAAVAQITRYLDVKATTLFQCPNLQPVILPDPKQGDIVTGPPPEPKPSTKKPAKAEKKAAALNELGQPVVP